MINIDRDLFVIYLINYCFYKWTNLHQMKNNNTIKIIFTN